MNITIIGSGYVGLTTGVALAYIGHQVTLLDIDANKIQRLQNGDIPIYEPGLKELLEATKSNISFISTWEQFDPTSEVVVIAVGTPMKDNGDADLSYIEAVAKSLSERLIEEQQPIIVNKSTVPIGTAQYVKNIIEQQEKKKGLKLDIQVASNPEFLREGVALVDTFYPDRIVIGADNEEAGKRLEEMYQGILKKTFAPHPSIPEPHDAALPALLITNTTSSELIKYAANSFLAMKISFINEFANLAEKVGADITEVAKGIGLDKRIGSRFLNAGIGWGGSCFPKDVLAISQTAEQYGFEMSMLKSTIEINDRQREWVIKKLQQTLRTLRGKTVGILGLSFKPDTDDLRNAPSIDIINRLLDLGADVKAYDPIAMDNFKKQYLNDTIQYAEKAEDIFDEAHAVVLVTEWNEFKRLPFEELGDQMKEKIIIDGRNVLNSEELNKAGYQYIGVGRG